MENLWFSEAFISIFKPGASVYKTPKTHMKKVWVTSLLPSFFFFFIKTRRGETSLFTFLYFFLFFFKELVHAPFIRFAAWEPGPAAPQ